MPHFRPIHVGVLAAICSSISIGMSSGTGTPLKLDSTPPPGRVIVASDENNARAENGGGRESSDSHGKSKNTNHDHGMNDDYGRGVNNNSFTATAHGSVPFARTAAGTNREPIPQGGAGGSNSLKPRARANSSNGHAVSEQEPPALLMMALFGLGMKGYCSERAACRVSGRP